MASQEAQSELKALVEKAKAEEDNLKKSLLKREKDYSELKVALTEQELRLQQVLGYIHAASSFSILLMRMLCPMTRLHCTGASSAQSGGRQASYGQCCAAGVDHEGNDINKMLGELVGSIRGDNELLSPLFLSDMMWTDIGA